VKKLKIAVAALVILPILIGISHVYLNHESDKMADMINSAEDSAKAGDVALSNRQLDEFAAEWDKNKRIFATFIRHAEIDIANQSAAKIKPYLDNDDKCNFYGECEALKMQIRHIAETETFCIENIL
jgi:hypothetical protein